MLCQGTRTTKSVEPNRVITSRGTAPTMEIIIPWERSVVRSTSYRALGGVGWEGELVRLFHCRPP